MRTLLPNFLMVNKRIQISCEAEMPISGAEYCIHLPIPVSLKYSTPLKLIFMENFFFFSFSVLKNMFNLVASWSHCAYTMKKLKCKKNHLSIWFNVIMG